MISRGVSVPVTIRTLYLTLGELLSEGMLRSSSVTELSLVRLVAVCSSGRKGRIELAQWMNPSFWSDVGMLINFVEKIALTMWYKFIMHCAANVNGTSLVNDNCELLH